MTLGRIYHIIPKKCTGRIGRDGDAFIACLTAGSRFRFYMDYQVSLTGLVNVLAAGGQQSRAVAVNVTRHIYKIPWGCIY